MSIEAVKNNVRWIDIHGNPVLVSRGITANANVGKVIQSMERGEKLGYIEELAFRDPNQFCAGELHNHVSYWEMIAQRNPSINHEPILRWIRDQVSIFPFFRHFKGSFKGRDYDCAQPPSRVFRNNVSCRPFVAFIQRTLKDRLKTGAISLVGRVGLVERPHLVLPLTMEPTKPRLCHDARYLNLWMRDQPFSLDSVKDLPRYVSKDSYQTVLDDKSGYDHILLTNESRTYFGIQWGGWYFTYNTLPFGWKISPYVYHTTGLMATNFFRSIGVPCLLYIDDRHNGQLQVRVDQGEYAALSTKDQQDFAAAQSALCVVAYHLVALGYFVGLSKSILIPRKTVPFLGFLVDSRNEAFHLIPEKKAKFLQLIRQTLEGRYVSVKTLQRLVGKCVSFSLAVPAARLFTKEMNGAISYGQRTQKPVAVQGLLREEISHWLFLEGWDTPLPWRDERHVQVTLATDASASGWGYSVVSGTSGQEGSDYWSKEERALDIVTREALAVEKMLLSCKDQVQNARVDVLVDNQAVVNSWNNQGGRKGPLNQAMKQLFFTTSRLNVFLHLTYVPTSLNPADLPSRRLSSLDCQLSPSTWDTVERLFGSPEGHTFDLMALDSNVMKDRRGKPLPHFTPFPSPESSGVNVFAQDLRQHTDVLQRAYVFPPLVLVGPLLRFLERFRQSCTVVILDTYPKKYWWPVLRHRSCQSFKLASEGDTTALLMPSKHGWVAHPGLPGDLWAFRVVF